MRSCFHPVLGKQKGFSIESECLGSGTERVPGQLIEEDEQGHRSFGVSWWSGEGSGLGVDVRSEFWGDWSVLCFTRTEPKFELTSWGDYVRKTLDVRKYKYVQVWVEAKESKSVSKQFKLNTKVLSYHNLLK